MKKLKIVNTVYGDASGGRWQALLNTHDALEHCGHEMWIVAGAENNQLSRGKRNFFLLNSSGFYNFWSAYLLNRWLRKVRPDIVIAHSGRAVYLFKNAMLFGGISIPVIAMNHSHNVKRSLRADGFIHITPYVAKRIEEEALKKNLSLKKPQAIISNLVYPQKGKIERFTQFHDPICLGIITRLVEYKGTHILIDALSILNNKGYRLKLLIAGEGEEKETLIKKVNQLGLEDQVEFLGWIQGEEKTNFYNAIDIAVVPTMNDTQPLAILDAFACGKVVVASDHISVKQIIRDGENGVLFEMNNPYSLAEKIKLVILDALLFNRISDESIKDFVNFYSFNVISKKLNIFLESLSKD